MKTVAPETVGLSSSRLKRIDHVMQQYVYRGQLAGMVTVLLRHGQPVQFGMYGQMDIDESKPMREDAIFRIFSMTKPITSLAVMMLLEEGAFHLQYPISMFIPQLADLKVLSNQLDPNSEKVPLERPITIHDLLTHTSGLGYGLDKFLPVDAFMLEAKMMRMDETLQEKINRLPQFPLHHQPGLRYTYSIGLDVLGRLVEVVSGMPLNKFFKKRIFEPLGMTDTDFFVPTEKKERLAALYSLKPDGKLVDISKIDTSSLPHFISGAWINKDEKPKFLSGGAGLVSTTVDYLRFGMMMRNQGELDGVRLVSRKTIELMTAPYLREDQYFLQGASFGLGFTILTDPARAGMLGSAGAYETGGAAHTNLWYDPQEDLMGLLMVQYVNFTPSMVGLDFKTLAAASIED